jgi:hypothetical protein
MRTFYAGLLEYLHMALISRLASELKDSTGC